MAEAIRAAGGDPNLPIRVDGPKHGDTFAIGAIRVIVDETLPPNTGRFVPAAKWSVVQDWLNPPDVGPPLITKEQALELMDRRCQTVESRSECGTCTTTRWSASERLPRARS